MWLSRQINTKASVHTDIAFAVGFADLRTFQRAFKKYTKIYSAGISKIDDRGTHACRYLRNQVLAGLPAEVRQQAQQLLGPGIGNTALTLIGPLFRPDTQKPVIAANYHFGVSVLQRAGRIGVDSPIREATLGELTRIFRSGIRGDPRVAVGCTRQSAGRSHSCSFLSIRKAE